MRHRTLSFLVLGIAAAAGICLYEGRAIARQREQLAELEQARERLTAENHQLLQQQDLAHGQLASVTNDASAKLTEAVVTDPAAAAALGNWRDHAAQLKQWAAKMADKNIPEMQLLSDDDWLEASRGEDLNTDIGVRMALFAVRQDAKNKFAPLAQKALQKYLAAHDDQLPATMAELQPYFDTPISDTILQRYVLTGTGKANDGPSDGQPPITERPNSQVDEIFDAQIGIYPHGMTSRSTMPKTILHTNEILQSAVKEYKANHDGQAPGQISDLQPYFTESVDENALQKIGWGWPTN